jgi:4-azaleucine resistance transporter AzlC
VTAGEDVELAVARRTLMPLIFGVAMSVGSFAVVFGLTARDAGYSVAEAMLMSLLPFAGASQLAAVGYVQQGLPWLTIALLTGMLNARHVLYSASLAPALRPLPLRQRLGMAQVLTDEAFALSAAHFQRLGRVDPRGYWLSAMLGVYLPWNLGTLIGVLAGDAIPDPKRLGLGVVFPAVMAGLAVGLTTTRVELVAACAGAGIGVGAGVWLGPAAGIVAGAVLGPLVALGLVRSS